MRKVVLVAAILAGVPEAFRIGEKALEMAHCPEQMTCYSLAAGFDVVSRFALEQLRCVTVPGTSHRRKNRTA